MGNLLGIDLGTSAVKALLLDELGSVLGIGHQEYPLLNTHPGNVEQDPHAWWEATVGAVRQALAGMESNAQLSAIGVSGQMHGTVLLDGGKKLLHPAVIWPDQRSTRQVDEISNLVGRRKLMGITGSLLAPGFQAATIRWFQQEKPELWGQVRHVLLPKDYLRWRMTGSIASDASDGSGSLLLDGQIRDWSSDLLRLLEIDQRYLPPIQLSASIAGVLLQEPAEEFGLPAGVPIITGAADTASSLLGAGVTDARSIVLSISTGGQLVWPCVEFSVDMTGRTHTFCSALEPGSGGAAWYRMGATLSAGGSLRWLRDNIFVSDGKLGYDHMTAWAKGVPIGSLGLLFLPYLAGERTPLMDPRAKGVFLGLSMQHDRASLVRAVMEGVVFSMYQAFQSLVEDQAPPEKIIFTGGGARSRLWAQIVADVFGIPVQTLLAGEGSAMGAALLAGAGTGLFELITQSTDWAKYSPALDPNAGNHRRYQELFGFFADVYQRIKEFFPRFTPDPGKTGSPPNSH